MPRADNSNPSICAKFDVKPNPKDPGAVDSIDLCNYCWWFLDEDEQHEVAHPPYEEQRPLYLCADCGGILTRGDN